MKKPNRVMKWYSSIKRTIWSIIVSLKNGCLDSVNVTPFISFIFQSKKLRWLFFKCLVLNGLVVCGSIMVFTILSGLISNLLQTNSDSIAASLVFSTGFRVLYEYGWMYPLKFLAHLLNFIWYLYFFDEANKLARKTSPTIWSYHRIIKFLTEYIYQCLLLTFFFIEATLMRLFPYVGEPLSFVFFCWLHAFLTFDYKWAHKGYRTALKARVRNFEASWDYYLGFGTPMMLLFYGLSYSFRDGPFLAFGITSVLFPIHIILALCIKPKPSMNGFRLPIFSHFSMKGVDLMIWLIPTLRRPLAKPPVSPVASYPPAVEDSILTEDPKLDISFGRSFSK